MQFTSSNDLTLYNPNLTKSKWNHRQPSIDKSKGGTWASAHMYRTSSNDMSYKQPQDLKTYVIPGYAGFINNRKGDSELGRTFTKIARRCLEKEGDFRKTCVKWQSTDFKTDQQTFDKTRPVQFRGYGRRTKYDEHEALHEKWSTTFRKTYLKPNLRSKPNAHVRSSVGDCEFDNIMKRSMRKSTVASGF